MLTLVALGGCAEEKPRIPLGAAGPATPVTLAEPDQTGLLPMSQWPAACDLLPETVVREVLPAATVVEMKRVTPTFDSGDVVEKDHVFPGDAECQIRVDFAEAKEMQPGRRGGWIYFTVRVAGTPELARKNYDENIASTLRDERTACPAELVAAAGLDDCTDSDGEWTFLKHGVAGELRGIAPYLNRDVYFEGQKENSYPTEIWHDTVGAEFLRAVAARLP
ncbi:hypothetical protein Q0Z83_075560 [Actinoplanes sichuanensis]|uniref:DUF3298 domain-containing protein n=1 Tax=Actinoplanes sichuanensis TaxID=512349 RepID=A0ABW4A876_9ACTN|nr:hypothetical protein [Actinoplanes sichuanensis]BEL09365.1 hypothetical protein Q0Z83_075560 [Actinoplanes sichuanensis]